MSRQMFALMLAGFLGLTAAPRSAFAKTETATFAGGCFWSIEYAFEKVKGVSKAVSGFEGGTLLNPTYDKVSGGGTGHLETVEVTYDPAVVTYEELLKVFWHQIDPTDAGGAFYDRGEQYKSALFVKNDAQRKAAEKSKAEVQKKFDKPIATEIRAATQFYAAEDYHQDYAKNNPVRYQAYRVGSGRVSTLGKLWGAE